MIHFSSSIYLAVLPNNQIYDKPKKIKDQALRRIFKQYHCSNLEGCFRRKASFLSPAGKAAGEGKLGLRRGKYPCFDKARIAAEGCKGCAYFQLSAISLLKSG